MTELSGTKSAVADLTKMLNEQATTTIKKLANLKNDLDGRHSIKLLIFLPRPYKSNLTAK